MKRSGIYLIKNSANGKVYVGQSSDVDARIKGHKRHLRKGTHFNVQLQGDFTLHGEYVFDFVVIEEAAAIIIDSREVHWISVYNSRDTSHGYNISSGGSSFTHSEQTKQKIRIAGTGRKYGPPSEETKLKMRLAKLGRKLTPEHKKKIGDSQRGTKRKPFKDGFRENMSAGQTRRFLATPMPIDPKTGRFQKSSFLISQN